MNTKKLTTISPTNCTMTHIFHIVPLLERLWATMIRTMNLEIGIEDTLFLSCSHIAEKDSVMYNKAQPEFPLEGELKSMHVDAMWLMRGCGGGKHLRVQQFNTDTSISASNTPNGFIKAFFVFPVDEVLQ